MTIEPLLVYWMARHSPDISLRHNNIGGAEVTFCDRFVGRCFLCRTWWFDFTFNCASFNRQFPRLKWTCDDFVRSVYIWGAFNFFFVFLCCWPTCTYHGRWCIKDSPVCDACKDWYIDVDMKAYRRVCCEQDFDKSVWIVAVDCCREGMRPVAVNVWLGLLSTQQLFPPCQTRHAWARKAHSSKSPFLSVIYRDYKKIM